MTYKVLDPNGDVIQVLDPGTSNCNAPEPGELCGGCDSCLLVHCISAGFKVVSEDGSFMLSDYYTRCPPYTRWALILKA